MMTELRACIRDYAVTLRSGQEVLPWWRGGRLRWSWLWMQYGREERRRTVTAKEAT